jgi:CO/xanthine dehydrogenase FAD-binding subunit
VTVSTYFQPASVPEALALLGEHGPDVLVIAGGTVAMPLINEGISMPRLVMGLRNAGLDGIERRGDMLRIGATATLTALATQTDAPMLATAARRTASWAVRNMGTVGGNLFTPPPGGDVATALLALDAVVEIAGPAGERSVPIDAFWTGFLGTTLAADELVTAITIPLEAGTDAFLKLGRKAANTPAVVTVAAHLAMEGGSVATARIALGAVGAYPVRARAAEAALTGSPLTPGTIANAAAAATSDAGPFTDAVATDWYRRRMVGVVVERTLTRLTAQAGRDA